MSVKRISGGGGQGRRPSGEVKGLAYFGEGSRHEASQDQLMLEGISRALGALATIKRSLSRRAVSRFGAEIVRWQIARADALARRLRDATKELPERFKAVREVDRWRSKIFGNRIAGHRTPNPRQRPSSPRAWDAASHTP